MTSALHRISRRLGIAERIGLVSLAAIAATTAQPAAAAPPAGFVVENIASGWVEPIGTTFMPDGRAVVWERGGRVWIVNANGTRNATPLLDINDEVGGWRDYGLMSVALDPHFAKNGHFYLLYVVDRHHLDHFGTAQYSAATNTYYAATIGRITRYTATAASNRSVADPASRLVLLGESAATGIPIVHQSHGLGSMMFGEDGTLLVTTGDAASYNEVDVGGQVADGYVNDAIARGILRAKENIGAFRSQLVDCLNGKLLRLDPATGDGVASNPWFDAAAPRSAKSRAFAVGLRNPFRATIIPGSGDHDPAAGSPGTVHIGDVGWSSWEEVSRLATRGANLGWPLFEGLEWHDGYFGSSPVNLDAPTGLSSPNPTHFLFRDLVRQDSLDTSAQLALNPNVFQQSESATASGALNSTTYAGFYGTGFRDYQAATGEWIQHTFTVPVTGQYTLWVRHANGSTASRPLRVAVDGTTAIPSLAFPQTGSWREWRLVSANLTLNAGNRAIRLSSIGSSGPNIDAVALTPAGSQPAVIPTAIPTWRHHRPMIDWSHASSLARTPGFTLNAATATTVGASGGASGAPFVGYCAIGGPVVERPEWPAALQGSLLFGDYVSNFIRTLTISPSGAITSVGVFDDNVPGLTSLAINPSDGSLWATRWTDGLIRYRYAPTTGQPPVARLSTNASYGASPLTVTLSAAASTDPEGGALTYTWNFGDGSAPFAGPAVVSRTYTAPSGVPTRFDPAVTVRDPLGNTSTASVVVSVNNTPPTVDITSIADGQVYPLDGDTVFPLVANVSDAEHGPAQRTCAWTTILHHNTHEHSEPPDASCTTSTVISPLGCGTDTYAFEIVLEVRDAAGLSAQDTVWLYPDCDGVLGCAGDVTGDGVVGGEDLAALLSNWGRGGMSDFDRSGATDGLDLATLLSAWGPCR